MYRPRDGVELIARGEERDFLDGRPGNHLFCPIECDQCSFYRLKHRAPRAGDPQDDLLQEYIRRANLDAFWSRRQGTVRGLVGLFNEQQEFGEVFGLRMFEPMGPFSDTYNSGMQEAVGVLYRSQKKGRHEAMLKFSSARKARSLFTDMYMASARGVEGPMVWPSDRTRFVATDSPTDSVWFMRFMTGYKARVGERRKQDAAIPVEVMVKHQLYLEEEWAMAVEEPGSVARREVAENAAFFLFLFCGSLRGFEGPKVLLSELRQQISGPESALGWQHSSHVGLPLSGHFKAWSQEQQVILLPIAYETASGLKSGLWAQRLVNTIEKQGIVTGWAFQDRDGEQRAMSSFEAKFYELFSAPGSAREPRSFSGRSQCAR